MSLQERRKQLRSFIDIEKANGKINRNKNIQKTRKHENTGSNDGIHQRSD